MVNNRLAMIVLNWNSAEDSMNCADSLLKQTYPVDIILIDNKSSDNSVNILEEYAINKPQVHFIKSSVNTGYSGGNNVGFTYALDKGYEYVGTLNPDATADEKWAECLIGELENYPDTGIVTGILARSDRERVDSTGDFYTTWGIPSPRGRDCLFSDVPQEPEYIFGSTGGGFITRTDMLRDIGFFDEKFFMYYEDVDLSFRAQLAGYKVRYTPHAVAFHKLSVSTNKVPGLAIYNTFKNLPMLYVKNMPLSLWWKTYPRFVLAYALILGNAIKNGRGSYAIKGWLKSWLLIPHMFKERAKIQKNRKVAAEYIDGIILHDIPPEQTGLKKFRNLFQFH